MRSPSGSRLVLPGLVGLLFLLTLGFTAPLVLAETKPFELEIIAKDGDPATGTDGTLNLGTDVSLAISSCGTAFFFAESTALDAFSSRRSGIWEGSGSTVLDVAIDGQILPEFMPTEEECIGVGSTCGELFRTSSVFSVTALGEITVRTSREDNLGTLAYLDGTARNNLAPILTSSDATIPNRSFIALKTESGNYLAGSFIGNKPFGEPDGGLMDFVTPLIGTQPQSLNDGATITDIYGTYFSRSGISFGFNQNADRVYVAALSDEGEAIYFHGGSFPSSQFLARTGDVVPGVPHGAYIGFSSFITAGNTGHAQVNDSRTGFYVAQWRNPNAPLNNLNQPRNVIVRFNIANGTSWSQQLIVSEYGHPTTDIAFPTSEFANTAFDKIGQVQIAANGDIWFFAIGRRVGNGGFPDNSDERAGLWRKRGDDNPELVWRYTTSNTPGSRLPDGPNVPGTPLPDGTFFVGTGGNGFGLDEHSHIVFTGPEGLYAEDTSGMRLVVARDQEIEVAPGDIRTVSSFSFNREGHIGGAMTAYRGDQLVFMVDFKGGSTAIFRTSKIRSFAHAIAVNSIGDAPDADLTDGFCDTGQLIGCQAECTLRAAVQQSNAKAGKQTINFDIPAKQKRGGIYEIKISSNLPIIDGPVIIDATTQPGYQPGAPVVELNAKPMGTNGNSWGFDISAGNTVVKGFWINSVTKNAIRLRDLGGNLVQSNIIGTNIQKATNVGTGEDGISIADSNGNTIGGSKVSQRNIISASGTARTGGSGIIIRNSNLNRVQGNYIGTRVNGIGDRDLGNGRAGIQLIDAADTLIGGFSKDAGNVISGNSGHGIEIAGAKSRYNSIEGNLIGLDANARKVLSNGRNGILLQPSSGADNDIGGATSIPGSGAGNIISGNLRNGIRIRSPGQNVIGNIIGTNSNSLGGLGNLLNGVHLESRDNAIGEGIAGTRNIVSGNTGAGILVNTSSTAGGERNNIDANFIGTNLAGNKSLPNDIGIIIRDSAMNKIGRMKRNVITGNTSHGIFITGDKSTSNEIKDNYIGVDKVGNNKNIGNGGNGIRLMGVLNTLVSGNVIGDNGMATRESGILIHGFDENGTLSKNQSNAKNTLINNRIFDNTLDGVLLIDSSQNRILQNTIKSNGQNGINLIKQLRGKGNSISGNEIFNNTDLGIDLDFDGVTANDPSDADDGANGLQNFPVINSIVGAPLNLVRGSIRSRPNRTYTVQIFINKAPDTPSGHGEGEIFAAAQFVTTNGAGFGSFTTGFAAGAEGDCVSATAQDNGTNDSSEFSTCVPIPPPASASLDFGDAPGGVGKYPTKLINNGARHKLGGSLFLGSSVDADLDGQPNANATGDDADGNDDEQGVIIPGSVINVSSFTQVKVTASTAGKLDAWVDFNGDGDWSDPADQVFTNKALLPGLNELSFVVPSGAKPGTTYARFRISTAGKLRPAGPAIDGEVEDYKLTVDLPPAPARPTGIKATDGTFSDKVRVTFNTVSGATVYRIFRCLTTGQTCGLPIGFPKTGSFDDIKGSEGTVYYYRVRACTPTICGKFSAANTGFRKKIPAKPTGIKASDGTYTQRVRVSWNAVNDATVYRVFRCTTKGQTCGSPIGFPNNLVFDDFKGTTGVEYYYRVRACTGTSCGLFSAANPGHRGTISSTEGDIRNGAALIPIPIFNGNFGRCLLIFLMLGLGVIFRLNYSETGRANPG